MTTKKNAPVVLISLAPSKKAKAKKAAASTTPKKKSVAKKKATKKVANKKSAKSLGATPKKIAAKKSAGNSLSNRLALERAKNPDYTYLRQEPSKAKNSQALLLTTLAIGAAGVLGYFGWQYFQKKKASNTSKLDEALLTTATDSSSNSGSVLPSFDTDSTSSSSSKVKRSSNASDSSSTADWSNVGSDFPLKKGSKGDKVKALQEAIIQKYGKTYLPKYGADGDFGSETVNALKKLKLPSSIDQTTFYVLTQGSGSSSTTSNNRPSGDAGKQFFQAAQTRNFSKVLSLLKQLKSKEDYQNASAQFQLYRLNGGVRKTLVNGLLSTFTAESQKQQIRFEFIRMGLKYDGNKWSLDGFGGKAIVTTKATLVWVNANKNVSVPAQMVLGTEIAQRLDYTLFEHNKQYFLVQTNSIKYL